MPRGLIAAMMILLVFAALMMLAGPGGGGSQAIMESDNPLPAAIDAAKGEGSSVGDFVNYVGLAGLIASFFSIIFAYSRQLFSLSRAGYLPARAVGDGRAQGADRRTARARGRRLPARRDHRGRRDDDQHRGVRSDRLLRADDALAHRAALARARPRAARTGQPGGILTRGSRSSWRRAPSWRRFSSTRTAAGITLGVYPWRPYFGLYSRLSPRRRAPEEEFDASAAAER
jgi:ethanolamine permease